MSSIMEALTVPDWLSRNSATVRALMSPEDSGALLLESMRQRLGLPSYDDVSVLDFGCGVRFTQAIINRDLRLHRYVGVDVSVEVIDWLRAHVVHPRIAHHLVAFRSPLFTPDAPPITPA